MINYPKNPIARFFTLFKLLVDANKKLDLLIETFTEDTEEAEGETEKAEETIVPTITTETIEETKPARKGRKKANESN